MSSASKGAAAIALVFAIVAAYFWGRSDERAGRAEPLTETASANKAELDVYYPVPPWRSSCFVLSLSSLSSLHRSWL